MIEQHNLPTGVMNLARLVRHYGGTALLVGGCVRDMHLMGSKPKDYDIEVYGLEVAKVRELLESMGRVDAVGASFGVFKLKVGSDEYDVSLPRRDSKPIEDAHKGRGRGFIVSPDPWMTVEEAAARRDYTINSMAYDPLEDLLHDPFNGEADFAFGRLVATSNHFIEDPLRVLRGMQFASRFLLKMDDHTAAMCRAIIQTRPDLAMERVWEEWWKWASKPGRPSFGLDVLVQAGWVGGFMHIYRMIGCPQEPEWHPEGDVWIHTKHCVDHVGVVMERETEYDGIVRGVLTLAMLLHDVGKIETTKLANDFIVSPGHAQAGGPLATSFLMSIGVPNGLIETIVPLVTCHMDHLGADINGRFVRRLARRLYPANVRLWESVVECDASGRPPKPESRPGQSALALATQEKIALDKPKEILMGRHVIAGLGITPGPLVGKITRRAYEAQLDGVFTDIAGAMDWMYTFQTDLLYMDKEQ